MTPQTLDQVILVDTNDNQIGVMDKVAAHRDGARLHRAISVFLFNKQGELLLQQRSAQKIVGAQQWANTCCGNVRPGESYEQCARRRLREELGITQVVLTPVEKIQYAVDCNEEFSEREMDQIFVGQYDGEVEPNPQEVQEVEWKAWPAVEKELRAADQYNYAPWVPIISQTSIKPVIN